MATQAAKTKRRAEALANLARLSELLADNLDIEVPDVKPTHRDPELAQILQLEVINDLLSKILSASGVKTGDSVDDMTKAELLALAQQKGVEVSKSQTKAEIIKALNA